MATPKLPILSPRRGRHVLLLPLTLHVGFLVLRGVEHGFRLLRRHSGHRLGRRSLILALRGRRTLRFALTAAASTTSTAATSSTALLLSERELVVPPRIRIGDRDL